MGLVAGFGLSAWLVSVLANLSSHPLKQLRVVLFETRVVEVVNAWVRAVHRLDFPEAVVMKLAHKAQEFDASEFAQLPEGLSGGRQNLGLY